MDRPVASIWWGGMQYFWRKGALIEFRPTTRSVDWTWDALEFV